MTYLYLPFIFQSVLMGIDEREHLKRGLGPWERLGHPLDSLTVLIPLVIIAANDFSKSKLTLYIALSIFSCLFITKDEFVHTRECNGFENWLHSLLFILHPIIFLSSGILWKYHPKDHFIFYQPFAVCIFMVYQIIRWSIPWKKIKT